MSARWFIWYVGFFGALASIAVTVVLFVGGHEPLAMVAQSGVFIGAALLIAANPHRR